MLKIYGSVRSRAIRVLWVLEELKATYEWIPIDLAKGQNKTLEFLRLNPSGKIPVCDHDGFILCESSAICTYLADQHPEDQMVPLVGTRERAEYDQWVSFGLCELDAHLWTIARHSSIYPQYKRVPAILECAKQEFYAGLEVLEKGLWQKSFLLGSRFTACDIIVGQTLMWALTMRMDLKSKYLAEYVSRIKQSQGFQKVRERYLK
jgi:glutathione S-transferase